MRALAAPSCVHGCGPDCVPAAAQAAALAAAQTASRLRPGCVPAAPGCVPGCGQLSGLVIGQCPATLDQGCHGLAIRPERLPRRQLADNLDLGAAVLVLLWPDHVTSRLDLEKTAGPTAAYERLAWGIGDVQHPGRTEAEGKVRSRVPHDTADLPFGLAVVKACPVGLGRFVERFRHGGDVGGCHAAPQQFQEPISTATRVPLTRAAAAA